MSAYFEEKGKKEMKKKKKKKHDGGEDEEEEERPKYKCLEPPPNRYGIWPCYRWDGVDRSKGFEQKLVDDITRRKVECELAYKWGSEDM